MTYWREWGQYVHLKTPGQPEVKATDLSDAIVAIAKRDIQGMTQ